MKAIKVKTDTGSELVIEPLEHGEGFKMQLRKDLSYSIVTSYWTKDNMNTLVKVLKKMTKNHQCEVCGNRGPDVEYVADPFELDVHGIEEMLWICDNCYEDIEEGL
jgi:ribosomal protein L37AE/L43A